MHSDEYQNTVYQNFAAILVDDSGDYMTSRSLKSRCTMQTMSVFMSFVLVLLTKTDDVGHRNRIYAEVARR